MLYELVSGQLPHRADSFGALFKEVLMTAPTPLSAVAPDVPRSIAMVIERALAKDPDARFSSAREMYDALERSTSGLADTAMQVPGTMPSTPATLPMGGAGSVPSTAVRASAPTTTPATPARQRSIVPLVALAALASMCMLGVGGGAFVVRDRLSAAWGAFLGAPTAATSGDPAFDPSEPSIAAPPSIPMHDGTEEAVGAAGMSIERCSRRRSADGLWIVDMPITLRNAGETGLTFQQSELAADGYVATAESDFPTLGMLSPGHAFSGYMVWRANEQGEPPETITLRFRGWARRIPVSDGPRLPPRPASSEPDPG